MPDNDEYSIHDVNTQRVGFLAFVPPLLRRLGVDSTEVLGAAGLHAGALENPEKFIPYDTAGRLLSISATKSGCPHFGLLLGQHIGTASLGRVGELMRSAPTLGDALRDLAAQQYLNARGGLVYLLQQSEQTFLGYAIYQPEVEGNSQICDAAAMAAYTIVRELAPSTVLESTAVMISRSAPLDATPYHELFGVRVQFNASQTGALIPTTLLRQPMASANAERRKALESQFNALSRTSAMDVVDRLRREMWVGLLSGDINADRLAAKLEMNRRTLHRRLADKGTSIRQILDETRCEFAQQLLAYTRLTTGEIGLVVQYREPGVFTRAFIRWTGITPTAWRALRPQSAIRINNKSSSVRVSLH